MRAGEIVRFDYDNIGRVAIIEYENDARQEGVQLGDLCRLEGHPCWITVDSLEIVTVAELFAAAGHPVPEGAILVRKTWTAVWERVRDGYASQESEERSAWFAYGPTEQDGLLPEFNFSDNAWKRMRYCVRDYLKILQVPIIDLSRLPALDAWGALPEIVKAVVK